MKITKPIPDQYAGLSATDRIRYQQLLLAQANKPSTDAFTLSTSNVAASTSPGRLVAGQRLRACTREL